MLLTSKPVSEKTEKIEDGGISLYETERLPIWQHYRKPFWA